MKLKEVINIPIFIVLRWLKKDNRSIILKILDYGVKSDEITLLYKMILLNKNKKQIMKVINIDEELTISSNAIVELIKKDKSIELLLLDEIVKDNDYNILYNIFPNHCDVKNYIDFIKIMAARYGSNNILNYVSDYYSDVIKSDNPDDFLNDDLILMLIEQSNKTICIEDVYRKIHKYSSLEDTKENTEIIESQNYDLMDGNIKSIKTLLKTKHIPVVEESTNLFKIITKISENYGKEFINCFKTIKIYDGSVIDKLILEGAFIGGNKQLINEKVNIDPLVYIKTAQNGFVECLKMANLTLDNDILIYSAHGAIVIDSVETLTYLKKEGLPLLNDFVVIAAKYGSFKCLFFLIQNGCGITEKAKEMAAYYKNEKCYKYMACFDGCGDATLNNKVEKDDDKEVDISDLNKDNYKQYLSKYNSNIKVLTKLYYKGCPWTNNFLDKIIKILKGGPMEYPLKKQYKKCFRFAYERHCYISQSTYRIAVNMGLIKQ